MNSKKYVLALAVLATQAASAFDCAKYDSRPQPGARCVLEVNGLEPLQLFFGLGLTVTESDANSFEFRASSEREACHKAAAAYRNNLRRGEDDIVRWKQNFFCDNSETIIEHGQYRLAQNSPLIGMSAEEAEEYVRRYPGVVVADPIMLRGTRLARGDFLFVRASRAATRNLVNKGIIKQGAI